MPLIATASHRTRIYAYST